MKRAALLMVVAWLASADCQAVDWVRWRGPTQNGVAYDTDLPDHWSPDPKAPNNNLIWKAPYGGRSTPIIMKGRVYFIDSAGEGLNAQERILCLNADTGELLWQLKFNVFHTDIDIVRVGWTNLAGDPETGNIYCHGTQGLFMCLDGKTGQVIWKHSLAEEYGRFSGYGGRLSSPVVDGNLVIVGIINASWGSQALPGNRWLAVDKKTGVPVWWSASPNRPKDTYASVPVIAVINGERLLITGGGDGFIHALRVRTGQPVWSYQVSGGGLSSSPVVEGNLVYICHSGSNPGSAQQGRVVCLDASKIKDGKPALVWQKFDIRVRYTSPLLHADRLYVCDESAHLYCFNAKTGKKLWTHKYGRNAKDSPVWADGKIYVADVNSHFHILKPSDKGCQDLDTQFFPSPGGGVNIEVNGTPAVANGKVYFTTSFEFYCIGKKNHHAGSVPIPPQTKEEPAGQVATVAHLQVVPADVVLYPGQSVAFRVQTFDDHGRYLGDLKKPAWVLGPQQLPPPLRKNLKTSLPPLKGDMTEDGKLTVDATLSGQFGVVIAKDGIMTARARVRVVPRLPYHQDFEQVPTGLTPAGWVNTEGKFVVVPLHGKKVLKKLANNASPLFARAHAYIGMPDLADYTIQTDLLSARSGSDLADMGLTNNRYILILGGNKQQLRIISWESTPHPRVDKTISFAWKPEVWYRMKMTVAAQGDKALVRGKVWERGSPEPQKWSITFEDPKPNRHGSPALYGFTLERQPGPEIFYDNVNVTPNQNSHE